jgi:hypothetical protein
VDTRTAILDTDAATNVGEACRDVLLQVSYQNYGPDGLDGTTYHAGHWISGTFFSGQTWSPEEGTVAADFVAMEMTLQAYAKATAEERTAIKSDLLGKAKRLKARVGSSLQHPSTPANPASQTDRAAPGS